MRFPNRLLIVFFLGSAFIWQMEDKKRIPLGFADCHTVRAAKIKGQQQEYVTGIVIRFVHQKTKSESFAVSHYEGFVSVPLRPGTYCFEAYDKNGRALILDPEQAKCFDLRAESKLEVGVVLAPE